MSNSNETGIQNLPAMNLPTVVDPIAAAPPTKPPPVRDRRIRESAIHTLAAWTGRFVVGVFMICNVFPLSFITAIAAFG
ncbi:MAG: hypothetical protein EXS16_01040 [Gemmataceae bacterium]|nr:hypothetical protein [Gemmataceae bacterium]